MYFNVWHSGHTYVIMLCFCIPSTISIASLLDTYHILLYNILAVLHRRRSFSTLPQRSKDESNKIQKSLLACNLDVFFYSFMMIGLSCLHTESRS